MLPLTSLALPQTSSTLHVRLAAACLQETRSVFIPGFDARGEEATSKKQTLRLRESPSPPPPPSPSPSLTAATAAAAAARRSRAEASAAITSSLRRSYALAIEALGVAAPRLRVRFALHVDGDERVSVAPRGATNARDGAGDGAAGRDALAARTLEDVALDEALDLRCPATRRAARGGGGHVTPFFERPGAPTRAAWNPLDAVGLRVGVRWSNGIFFTGTVERYDAAYVRSAAAARAAVAGGTSGAAAAASAAAERSAASDAAPDTSGAAWKCYQVSVRAERCALRELAPLVRDERVDTRGGRSYGFAWRDRGWADEAAFDEEFDAAVLSEGRERAVVAHRLSLSAAEHFAVALYCRGIGAVVHGPSRAAPLPLLATSAVAGAHFVRYGPFFRSVCCSISVCLLMYLSLALCCSSFVCSRRRRHALR